MISCKEATQFITLREEGKLSLRQRWQLWQHLAVCGFCRLFSRQNRILSDSARHIHQHHDVALTAEQKASIVKSLEEL